MRVKPYLVVASGDANVDNTDVNTDFTTTITATADESGDYELCGTLYGMDNAAAAAANAYILQSNGTWGKVKTENQGAYIPPFRAYIVNKSGGAARLYSVIEGTTGIVGAPQQGVKDENWYSLDGRKLNGRPVAKGVYVHGNKKEIVE